MEQIEQLEIRIEELREAIERSRRLMLAGQACGVEDRRGGRTRRSTTAQIAVEGCALAVLISNDLSHSLHSPARARPAGGGLKTVELEADAGLFCGTSASCHRTTHGAARHRRGA